MPTCDKVRCGLFAVAAGLMCVLLSSAGRAQVKDFTPVTEDMLRRPDPSDWINWRRTSDNWAYSPLTKITKQNVKQLQLVWSATSPTGSGEESTLVYKGVLYWPTTNGIRALDGATGRLLWEYTTRESDPAPTGAGTRNSSPGLVSSDLAGGAFGIARRNIAIYADKIIAGTSDAQLIALDARTGKLVWKHQVADHKLGYQYTSGPIIVKGKVIAGMTGCDYYKDDVCFISAHDAETGKELWRTETVARPGAPGGDTWGNLPLRQRAGSDAWIPGSYDPQTNLIYWSTSQAKPWTQAQRGNAGASLYTNCTLAIDPENGKMVWYFQHIPAETHDLDEVFEAVLVNNGNQRSLFKMGKIGVMWELDRRTGKFLHAYDAGYQNVASIDPASGKVTLIPERIPKLGVPVEYCPGPGGFKNLYAMAFNPDTHAFYIPMKLSCANSTFDAMPLEGGRGGVGPAKRRLVPHPESPNEMGEFLAMDSRSGTIVWRKRNPRPLNTAALTTATGLVFVGDIEGRFSAMDAATGDVLWETKLSTSADGFPITYAINGRQYLVVPSGSGWFLGWQQIEQVLPNAPRRPASSGTGIHVYALPQ
jgi:alcohol dehydrogenase (cytochrome c)